MPTSGIQWTSEQLWLSDRPQKQTSEKADQSTLTVVLWKLVSFLMELYIGDENHYLPLCAYLVGFGKAET